MLPESGKLVVMGCSCGGREALRYLVPRVRLGSSAVVCLSHIQNNSIYFDLSDLGIDVSDTVFPREIRPGRVYLPGYAPQGEEHYHSIKGVELDEKTINSIWRTPEGYSDMNVDSLMKKAASAFGERCIGVVLSGAGDDGVCGAKSVKNSRGRVFVQIRDEDENGEDYKHCYFSEMPECVVEAVGVDFAGPLAELAEALNRQLSE